MVQMPSLRGPVDLGGVECNNAVVLAAALRLFDCETQLPQQNTHKALHKA